MAIAAGRLWPGKGEYKASDLGNTRGMAFVVSPSWKEEKVDQFGDTIVNKWGFGIPKVSADVTLAEMTDTKMGVVTGETPAANAVKIKATSFIGSNMLAFAGAFKIFPIIAGAPSATAQMEMPLAYPQFDLNLNFSDAPQGMKASFVGFPNEADSNTIAVFNEV